MDKHSFVKALVENGVPVVNGAISKSDISKAMSIADTTNKPLKWNDFKPCEGDELEKAKSQMFDLKEFGDWGFGWCDKAVLGEITIYKMVGNGGIGAPMMYKIFHNGKEVASGGPGNDSNQVWKKMEKDYINYATKNELLIRIPVGKPIKPKQDQFLSILSERSLVKMEKIESILASSESSKHIWNVDFVDLKTNIKSVWEELYKKSIDLACAITEQTEEGERYASDLIKDTVGYNFPTMKIIDKLTKSENNAVKFFCDLVSPLVGCMERTLALQPFIEKGRKPSTNAPVDKFTPKYTRKGAEEVKKIYTDMLDKIMPEFIAHIVARDMDAIPMAQEAIESKNKQRMMRYSWVINRYFNRGGVLKPEAEIQQIAAIEAEKEAKSARESLINKNVAKVAAIIERRNDFKEAVIKSVRFVHGLEGEIKFVFGDGAEFTVRNKMVQNWSPSFKPYYQYPTTFHDVILSNGQKTKFMSEEQLNKEF